MSNATSLLQLLTTVVVTIVIAIAPLQKRGSKRRRGRKGRMRRKVTRRRLAVAQNNHQRKMTIAVIARAMVRAIALARTANHQPPTAAVAIRTATIKEAIREVIKRTIVVAMEKCKGKIRSKSPRKVVRSEVATRRRMRKR